MKNAVLRPGLFQRDDGVRARRHNRAGHDANGLLRSEGAAGLAPGGEGLGDLQPDATRGRGPRRVVRPEAESVHGGLFPPGMVEGRNNVFGARAPQGREDLDLFRSQKGGLFNRPPSGVFDREQNLPPPPPERAMHLLKLSLIGPAAQ